MGLASYEIIGNPGAWRVSHDGRAENVYQTKKPPLKPPLLRLHWRCVKVTKCALRLPDGGQPPAQPTRDRKDSKWRSTSRSATMPAKGP
jgi:hypothetical protein